MEYNNDTTAGATAPGISRPAPYGRACVNCARAKCKCILRSSGGSCERCFRLKKECSPSASVRKKRATTRNSSQTARLERKLDGLVSLLKASSQGGALTEESINDVSTMVNAAVTNAAGAGTGGAAAVSASSPSPATAATASTSITPSASTPASMNKFPQINNSLHHLYETYTYNNAQPATRSTKTPGNPLTPASTNSSAPPFILAHDIEPTPEEEKLWYDIFKEQFLDYAPFLRSILKDISCSQLRQERPFLWLTVMSVSCPFLPKQTGLGQAVREVLARDVFVEGERKVDYLLGALCFAQWAHYHFQMGPLLTLLSGACTSILLDLELDKPAPHDFNIKQPGRMLLPRFSHKLQIPETRTMEHRRIALATWALSCNTAFFHHKTELLPWSPYLDDCLKFLEEAKESYSDELFVYQIKLQQFLSNVSMIYARLRGSENEQSTRLIVPYVRSVKRQLVCLKNEIPSHVAEDRYIQITMQYVEVAVNEVALVRAQHTSLMADKGLETMECLIECLHSIRTWTEIFMKFHYRAYIGAPMGLWKQLSLMMYTLVRLATLDDPAWDTEQVRRTVDLPALLDHVSTCMSHVAGLSPWKRHAENVHSRSSRLMAMLMTWTKSVYEGAMPPVQPPCAGAAAAAMPPATAPVPAPATTTTTSRRASPAVAETPLSQAQTLQQQQNQLLMMGDGAPQTPSAAAYAQQQYQGQMTPLPQDLFPYLNQAEPWADDIFGFWDIWSAGRQSNLE